MSALVMFLTVLGLVCFFLATLTPPTSAYYNRLVPAGLFCWLLANLIQRVPL
jgi:hypothetical protein